MNEKIRDELIKLFLSHVKEYDDRCFNSCWDTKMLTSTLDIHPITHATPTWYAELMAHRCEHIFRSFEKQAEGEE